MVSAAHPRARPSRPPFDSACAVLTPVPPPPSLRLLLHARCPLCNHQIAPPPAQQRGAPAGAPTVSEAALALLARDAVNASMEAQV
jgi:hypothetical protein